jgi:hypothetical protein
MQGVRQQRCGCLARHSTDDSLICKVGPSWRGLFGTTRLFPTAPMKPGKNYIKQSIMNPSAKVVRD